MVRVSMVILTVAAIGSTGIASAASPAEKLERAQKRLDAVREELSKVSAACERDEDRVERINTRVEDTWAAVTEAEVAVDQQSGVVEEAEQRLREVEAEAREVEDTSATRVAELYKRGLVDPTLHSLLMSSSTEQALSRAQVLNIVKHGDREVLEQLLSSKAAVDGQRELFEQQREVYEQALSDRRSLVNELQDLRTTYEQKVAECNEQVVELQQEKAIAEEDERKLADAIADSGVPVDVPPSVSEGGWVWPARGALTSGFGYRWGRLHAGIDIGAPTGTPIYAAKGGVVSFAGTMGGYGNIVVINHGGGMTTRYAHQSRIGSSVGQTVTAGQNIGWVGNTGNSTGPHLHFEIRINGEPQDPIGYVR